MPYGPKRMTCESPVNAEAFSFAIISDHGILTLKEPQTDKHVPLIPK